VGPLKILLFNLIVEEQQRDPSGGNHYTQANKNQILSSSWIHLDSNVTCKSAIT